MSELYFVKLKPKLDSIIKFKNQNLSKLILTIYSSAIKLTKKQIRIFKTIDIRVLEGISPSSFAKDFNEYNLQKTIIELSKVIKQYTNNDFYLQELDLFWEILNYETNTQNKVPEFLKEVDVNEIFK